MRSVSHGAVDVQSAGIEPTTVPDFVEHWVGRLRGEPVKLHAKPLSDFVDERFDHIITLCDKSHAALPEHPGDHDHVRWDFRHPDSPEAVSHFEIELSERIRLFLQAKHLV